MMLIAARSFIADEFLRPLEFIRAEHDHQLLLSDRLMEMGQELGFKPVADVADVLLSYLTESLPLHAKDEEDDLFPRLRHRCRQEDGFESIVAQLEQEHAVDKFLAHDLVVDLNVITSRRTLDSPLRLFYNLRGFAEAQRRHLTWENSVVLPLARKRLDSEDLDGLGHNMAVRRGVAYPARQGASNPAQPISRRSRGNDTGLSLGKRILIVDDNAELRQTLSKQLEVHAAFAVDVVANGVETLEKIERQPYDLVLLDVGLPDIDGHELCKIMRRKGCTMPIIMLTAANSDADTILGLDSGANDYITKPFRLGVLLARMRAQLRQHMHSDGAIFTIGPYAFQPSAKRLVDRINNKEIRLTEKEVSILKYLLRSGNKSVPSDVLLEALWDYTEGVTTHTVETHIYRLRQKIERNSVKPRLLVTECNGYRLVHQPDRDIYRSGSSGSASAPKGLLG